MSSEITTRDMRQPGSSSLPTVGGRLVLRSREEQRILRGHRWVFSNEIARIEGVPEQGGIAEVVRQDGRLIGQGFYNAHSLIAVRMLTEGREVIDHAFLEGRLRRALMLRKRLYPTENSFRLVHGESDDLPGLIVDKYEDCLVLQTLCMGMDRLKDTLCDALEEILKPRCIIERNQSSLREREGLPQISGTLRGEAPETVVIQEEDLRFEVDLLGGQKTGFYFDQRENRSWLRRFAKGMHVLDAFCHEGGFALHAARAGAAEVRGLDVSKDAIARAQRNAAMNGLEGVCRFEVGEAVAALEALHSDPDRFDMVILDPPSFTRSRKNVPAAKKGYEEVNRKGLRLLRRGGILATASCSFHITDETFMECVQEAAVKTGRTLRMLAWRSQAPDHPVLPAMPETRYLKFGVFQVD